MPEPSFMQLLGIAIIVVVALSCVAFFLDMRRKNRTVAQEWAAVRGSQQAQQAVSEAEALWQRISTEIEKVHAAVAAKPFPDVGATFPDMWDAGEKYGEAHCTQAVTINGAPIKPGGMPVIVLEKIGDGPGLVRKA